MSGHLVAETTDRWLSALEALVPVPPEYRERQVDRTRARSILGCKEPVLDLLIERGLPVAGRDAASGGPLFDYHDLINVGLRSGSGLSLGEQAQRSLMRFALAPAATWTGDKRWSLQIEHRCAAGSGSRPRSGGAEPGRPAPGPRSR